MSTSLKWVVGIVVVLALFIGFKYLINSSSSMNSVSKNETPVTTNVSTQNSQNDVSDSSIDSDLNSINVEMSAVDESSSGVDASLNDKPVTQTE